MPLPATDPLSAPDRRAQLAALVDALGHLLDVLAHDPAARAWRRHFADCRARAEALAAQPGPSTPDARAALAGAVMGVFGGMGSFNDYAPVAPVPGGSGRYAVIPGMEAFSDVAGRAYEAALALRVVGTV